MAKNNAPQVNLNLNVRGLSQSATLRINALSNEMRRQGKTVYKMGLGQSPFPVAELILLDMEFGEDFFENNTRDCLEAMRKIAG